MYSQKNLKPHLAQTPATVHCPVIGCSRVVARQHRIFKRSPDFLCPEHRIYIGPATFEYVDARDNLLWTAKEDIALLDAVQRVKRESRMARERSEDALTWNVFRGLDRMGLLSSWVERITNSFPNRVHVHYWSFDQSVLDTWPPLAMARKTFGELPARGSEPDIVVETDEADIWIEAKFGSGNDTQPSDKESARLRYSMGACGWLDRVCQQDFDSLAITAKRYELLRLWLLGSHAAQERSKKFLLVNLVRQGKEEDVEVFSAGAFRQNDDRQCRRATWEEILAYLDTGANADLERLADYMRTKTLGYDRAGNLVKAFRL